MSPKSVSILGILVSASCLGIATTFYPGGFDWSRDFISTLLRGPAGTARTLAIAGVLLFCVSLALVFERLARAAEFSKISGLVRVAGIGSMVYAALTITPMHDVMVSTSLVFLLAALLPLAQTLYTSREIGFFVAGSACLVVLGASAAIYYSGLYVSVLPWAQRASFALITTWLVSLDWAFSAAPRGGSAGRLR